VFKFEDFSTFQRAVTIAGLGPAMLVGCTVHGDPSLATYLPAAYGVSLAFPWGDAKAKASAWKPTAPAPRALDQAIRGITNNFEGLVGVAVTSIDDGWIVASNGERPMPQQSVSKLWVAMTVLDQVDQGRIRLEDPITITRADFTLFHQPVAALVKGDAGYTASVGEIIRRAMQMSDNTCNDKLLRLVGGPDAVRTFLARKGITGVRFGPGEKLLQAGTAGLAATLLTKGTPTRSATQIARDAEEAAAPLELRRIDGGFEPEQLVDELRPREDTGSPNTCRLRTQDQAFAIETLELCAIHLDALVVPGLSGPNHPDRAGEALSRAAPAPLGSFRGSVTGAQGRAFT